jgi:tRNA(fMet)-specific endonuclease VapC
LILLDSNAIIHYIKGIDSVISQLQAAPARELAIPSIMAYEIEYGNRKTGTTRRRSAISALLNALAQIPFDYAAAIEAARIRVDLETRGVTIGPIDLGTAARRLDSMIAIVTTPNANQPTRSK